MNILGMINRKLYNICSAIGTTPDYIISRGSEPDRTLKRCYVAHYLRSYINKGLHKAMDRKPSQLETMIKRIDVLRSGGDKDIANLDNEVRLYKIKQLGRPYFKRGQNAMYMDRVVRVVSTYFNSFLSEWMCDVRGEGDLYAIEVRQFNLKKIKS